MCMLEIIDIVLWHWGIRLIKNPSVQNAVYLLLKNLWRYVRINLPTINQNYVEYSKNLVLMLYSCLHAQEYPSVTDHVCASRPLLQSNWLKTDPS